VRSAHGRRASIRLFVLACLAAAALATIGGALFYAIHGGTMVVSGSRSLARHGLPQVDGWVFVTAAFVLTGIGAVVDALGSG